MDVIHNRVSSRRGGLKSGLQQTDAQGTMVCLATDWCLPLPKELAGEVGLVAIETLKLVLDVPKSAAAPTDMADAGRVVHPQLACALACICAYDLYSCGTANGTQIRPTSREVP